MYLQLPSKLPKVFLRFQFRLRLELLHYLDAEDEGATLETLLVRLREEYTLVPPAFTHGTPVAAVVSCRTRESALE